MTDDRRSRDLELLKNAVDRDRSKRKPTAPRGAGQMLYRGQLVAGQGGGRAPGAPRSRAIPSGDGSSGVEVKEALRNLTQLFNDGLITTAEYDAKRAEILDRL